MNCIESILVQCNSPMSTCIPYVKRDSEGNLKNIIRSKFDHYYFKIVPINDIGRELMEHYEILIPNSPFQNLFCGHNYRYCLKKKEPTDAEWSNVIKHTKSNFKRVSAIDWTISNKNGYIYSYKFKSLLYNCEHYHCIRLVYKSLFRAIIKCICTLHNIRNRKKGIHLFFLGTIDSQSPLSRFRHSIHSPITTRIVSYLKGHNAKTPQSSMSNSSSIQLTI